MADVRFLSPYKEITKTEWDSVKADTVEQLCSLLLNKYGPGMGFLFDAAGNVSKKLVILVNRRGIHTLDDGKTVIKDSDEVIFMPYLGWA